MKDDARLLFIVKALHCVAEAGESLDSDETDGLKQVIETVIIDGRKKP